MKNFSLQLNGVYSLSKCAWKVKEIISKFYLSQDFLKGKVSDCNSAICNTSQAAKLPSNNSQNTGKIYLLS